MTRRNLSLLSLICWILAAPSQAQNLSSELLEYGIRLSGAESASHSSPLLIVWDLAGAKSNDAAFQPDLFSDLILMKLENAGIPSKVYSGDFRSDFVRHRVTVRDLLADKLVISIDENRNARQIYSADVAISFLQAHANDHGDVVRTSETWRWNDRIESENSKKLHSEVEQSIRRALTKNLRKTTGSRRVSDRMVSPSRGDSSAAKVRDGNFSLEFLDTEGKRARFFVGAGLGTPALINVNLGYWGGRDLPLFGAVSGMYLSSAVRGIEGDLGWAFDNSGTFRQAVAFAVAGLNETSTKDIEQQNSYGQVVSTTTLTTNILRPYLGPSYFLRWKAFMAQAGVGAATSSDASSRFRGFLQVSFTPEFFF